MMSRHLLYDGFVPGDLSSFHAAITVEETADHIIGLTGAAVPCAEFQAFQAILHGGPFRQNG